MSFAYRHIHLYVKYYENFNFCRENLALNTNVDNRALSISDFNDNTEGGGADCQHKLAKC